MRGQFFYLYAVIDLFSHKLVAWEVHERESGEDAAVLIERACWREQRREQPLVLHADNGAAQTAYTLRAKLQAFGITPSYSRPGVSDDNAYIEAWVRTCKYAPSYPPDGFETIELAREWVLRFVTWYNGTHRHSALAYVDAGAATLRGASCIAGTAPPGLAAARQQHPLRWKRHTRPWDAPDQVWLNPPSTTDLQLAA